MNLTCTGRGKLLILVIKEIICLMYLSSTHVHTAAFVYINVQYKQVQRKL